MEKLKIHCFCSGNKELFRHALKSRNKNSGNIFNMKEKNA